MKKKLDKAYGIFLNVMMGVLIVILAVFLLLLIVPPVILCLEGVL